MNVFVLSVVASVAATLHCDKHVVKMILESTQILYTVLDMHGSHVDSNVVLLSGERGNTYKPTHKHHPCVLWTAGSVSAFKWVLNLAFSLCSEFEKRYGKEHKCKAHLKHILNHVSCKGFPASMPSNIEVKDWICWVKSQGVKSTAIKHLESRICTKNVPEGCTFCVAALSGTKKNIVQSKEEERNVVEDMLCRDMDGCIDAVDAYNRYYIHKSRHMFNMTYCGQTVKL